MANNVTLNTDYLKFDAFSIKKLIKQKLSEDPTFTDYVYDGSNLSILIDIFSNMFQVLLYNLNHTAAESMFSDTQIYENMNRLVKFIGYNPRGYSVSSVLVDVLYGSASQGIIVPPYSYIKLNKNDKTGKPIYYSTVDYYHLYATTTTNSNVFSLYNGEWTKYNKTFISEGIPYEKFVLEDLISDSYSTSPTYIAYPYIHVYIKRKRNSTDNSYETIRFEPNTTGLFIDSNSSSIFDSTSKIFNLRLNEYKQYEIQFGDGIHGESLKTGDIVYIIYMNSNGPDGVIGIGDINNENTLQVGIKNIEREYIDSSILSMTDIIRCLFSDSLTIFDSTESLIDGISNIAISSMPTSEESVDEIRNNAPQWFKSVGRLVTQKDFDFFIRSKFYNDIVDIKIMNNWEYICTFYKWLYIRGINSTTEDASATKYINSSLSSNYGYKYADSADSNNVYIWIKTKTNSSSLLSEIEDTVRPLKPLTSEPVFATPITKAFFPCAYNNNYDINLWDPNAENYIEIEIEKNTVLSFEAIKSMASTYIQEYFSLINQKIGGLIDLNQLNSYILSIDGVKNIRTVYVNPLNQTDFIYINGLSFACWTPDIINGEDLMITNSSFTLEPFQFATLASNTIIDSHIKIITESSFQTNQIEY